jgi:hypothetical protein
MNLLKINVELNSWYNFIRSKLSQNENEVEKLNMQHVFFCLVPGNRMEYNADRIDVQCYLYSRGVHPVAHVIKSVLWFGTVLSFICLKMVHIKNISLVWYIAYEIIFSNVVDVISIPCRSKQQRLYQANHSKLTLRFAFLGWRLFAMTKSGQIAWP